MINLKDSRISILGANSMLGRHTYDALLGKGAIIDRVYHQDTDLLSESQTLHRIKEFRPDYVFNFAGFNGGIKFNQLYPHAIFHKTCIMNLNILNACLQNKVKKLLNCLTSCAYPVTEEPLKEEDFLKGEPHHSVACHAYGKRSAFIAGLQAVQQYNFNVVGVILNNCFGPYDAIEDDKLKFGGALIKRFVEAKIHHKTKVEVWGSGLVKRELCYAENAAIGLVRAMEHYEHNFLPLNIGTGQDYTIKEYAEKIAGIVGYTGQIYFDISKPDGQKRKILDISRMKKLLRWEPEISLEDGIKKTANWYESLLLEIGGESDR